MELSRHSPAPARYTGIGIVIAVHIAAITALSLGFIKPMTKPQSPIQVVPLPKTQEPPPLPPQPTQRNAAKPILTPVPVPPIPIPDEPTITPDLTRFEGPTSIASVDGPIATGTPTVVPPPVAPHRTEVRTPGAVCSVMPRPEVPVVNWSGEAVLQVMATVRGGRVVGSEFRFTQGALDSKSRRALQRSVESALAAYQCQGDAVFQQDFAFRLD